MRRRVPGALCAGCAVLLLLGARGDARESNPARAYLADAFDLTAGDLDRIDSGKVESRTIKADDRREVATLGVIRMRITPEYYIEGFDDIASFKRDAAILQIGAFGRPPALQDVAGLSLDDSDVRSLRGCRVGDCDVQLSADAIGRFRREIDWRLPDARERANALMRQILVEYVTEYLRTGPAASMEYADEREPVSLRREFLALTESAAGAWPHFPALRRHLAEFPSGAVHGTSDLLYWSKEKIGRKGVASVTHVAIARGGPGSPAEYAVASKHIYGTHYFDASLGLTVLVRDRSATAPATYVVYLNRSRIDVLDGMFGGVARRIVSARARGTVAQQLARMQRTLEGRFAARSAGNGLRTEALRRAR